MTLVVTYPPVEQVNIELEEGANQNVSFIYRDALTNLPIDLTGFSAEVKIRSMLGSPYVLQDLSTDIGNIVLGEQSGVIIMNFFPPDTLEVQLPMGWDRGNYDLFLTEPGTGNKIKVRKGFVLINRSTTTTYPGT